MDYLINSNLDFSIIFKEISQTEHLWLGPAAYVNHDCQPNCKLYTLKVNGKLCLQSVKDIYEGEEITWNYGKDYFKRGECECVTCKGNKDEKGKTFQ